MLLRLSIVAGFGILVAPPTSVAQAFQELYSFAALTDGYSPRGAVVEGADGDFYGTTYYGGQPATNCPACGYGTVFRITPAGALTTVAWFYDQYNGYPFGQMVLATDGNFYGTTEYVFRVSPTGALTTIRGAGLEPVGNLVQATDGYLYGADAHSGGIYWTSLDGSTGGSVAAPGTPSGGLIQANDGNFYGLTDSGGAYGFGTAYKLTPSGQLSILASFGHNPRENYPVFPYGKLLQATDGNLYGVAEGGYSGNGAVFRLTLDGSLTTLASFNGLNGDTPNSALIEANDGNLYSTTKYGGAFCCPASIGTVFKLTPAGQITTVVTFTGQFGEFRGSNPIAGLVQGTDGNLYGTCPYGGSHGLGNVFRIIMPGPELYSARSGRQLVLSWRTNYSGFTLQSSADLGGESWTDVTNPPVIAAGMFWVTNGSSGSSQFFRLKR